MKKNLKPSDSEDQNDQRSKRMKISNPNNNNNNNINNNYKKIMDSNSSFFYIWRNSYLRNRINGIKMANLVISMSPDYLNQNISFVSKVFRDPEYNIKFKITIDQGTNLKSLIDCQHLSIYSHCAFSLPTIPPNFIPSHITFLDITGNLAELAMGSLPESLEKLLIRQIFTQDIEPGLLPSRLLWLSINDFRGRIFPGGLPPMLTFLKFSESFDQEIEQKIFPDSLTYLNLGNFFRHLISREFLPKNIRHFKFYLGHENEIQNIRGLIQLLDNTRPLNNNGQPIQHQQINQAMIFDLFQQNIQNQQQLALIPQLPQTQHIQQLQQQIQQPPQIQQQILQQPPHQPQILQQIQQQPPLQPQLTPLQEILQHQLQHQHVQPPPLHQLLQQPIHLPQTITLTPQQQLELMLQLFENQQDDNEEDEEEEEEENQVESGQQNGQQNHLQEMINQQNQDTLNNLMVANDFITNLDISVHFQFLPGNLPPRLTKLYLDDYNFKLVAGMFPETLLKIVLPYFNQPLEPGIFPINLKSLQLSSFNRLLRAGVLPAKLENITFSRFNGVIEPNALPNSLSRIVFPNYKRTLEPNIFPNSLTYLDLSNYKAGLQRGILLQGLKLLLINDSIGPLEPQTLPQSLTKLSIKDFVGNLDVQFIPPLVNQIHISHLEALKPISTWPSTIKHLEINSQTKYDQPQSHRNRKIPEGFLPNSLQTLEMMGCYLLPKQFPTLLNTLIFHSLDRQFKEKEIPNQVKKLVVKRSNQNHIGFIPKDIEVLEIDKKELVRGQISKRLKKLKRFYVANQLEAFE
ncbi:hypothetical protein CYY_009191 [Polysphondylium violaceum]|uniref:FNIP repeat-containing protein n=1 Tax=Polysphondylium violaceum TaxID=133409 RepID=A0A8J4UWE1_9MYCE|nr:hypothetical protein CYY_009191 [Polysphondylium violaceum]